MSHTVAADITVSVNVSDANTGGTLAGGGTLIQFLETAKLLYNANAPNTPIGVEWSGVLNLVASTPQTLNLASLAGPLGATVTFASVVAIYVYNTGAHPVGMGNAGSNVFAPGWSETTHVETIGLNSRWLKENNGTAWPVSGSAENLMFDPGSNAGSVRVILLGN